jgi:D-serine deaminase-like pyridoxal phosphate-dependent protein
MPGASSEQVTTLDKGVGGLTRAMASDAPAPGWSLLAEEVSLPAAVLSQERLTHNLRWMQSFAEAYGVKLAPHGKTTMAPQLFRRQVEAGAWGITVATAQQAQVALHHGIPRVLMANLLVGRRNLERVAEALAGGRFEFVCLVDSAEAVAHLGRFFRDRRGRVEVLLELGPRGGRTGARDAAQEAATLDALEHWGDAVGLAGVEVYEGVLKDEMEIRELLRRAVVVLGALASSGRVTRPRPILSGAGSAWYDVVAEEFACVRDAADVLLRPGCYLCHDVGAYRVAQERVEANSAVARRIGVGLRPALQIWAYVLSTPEPERAIVGLGKRDVAFDAGFPEPALRFRPGQDPAPRTTPEGWAITGMMDQHAYLRVESGHDLRVGDMLAFDISHPCLTFDKWRQIAMVDADHRVVELIHTFF